ncbi:hypothetical protein D3C87_1293210 [compost metagenome]
MRHVPVYVYFHQLIKFCIPSNLPVQKDFGLCSNGFELREEINEGADVPMKVDRFFLQRTCQIMPLGHYNVLFGIQFTI